MLKSRLLAALVGLFALLCALCGAAAEYATDMTEDEVQALEERLSALGFLSTAPNGSFDADTRLALEAFQQANALEVTGEADAATLDTLDSDAALSRQQYLSGFADSYRQMEPMKNGDISNQVQTMQRRLKELGYFSGGADGVFGDATQTAVERFQMVCGLNVTGVADGMTMLRLTADMPVTWQGFLSEMSATSGDMGLNVYVLQKKLAQMGYFEGACTGSYSDFTQRAVAQFQADNGLDDTGVADAATWEKLYSDGAVARKREDVIQMGDYGENVTQIQRQLSALGYYGYEASGVYDYTTETAVRLFQMASSLPSSGDADADTLARLMSDSALPLNDPGVQESFSSLIESRGDTVQAVISEIATQMLGAAFETPDSDLYPGFALVQYVCVAAGMPITRPEALIDLADTPVADAQEVESGNIVALQLADSDSVNILLTIGAGDGRVIYATPRIGWVVMSYIDRMESASVYRWAEALE